jgi:hypothetical protein
LTLLLDVGVIVNHNQEVALASPARRATTAKAVVKAVTKLCGDRKTPAYKVTNGK